MKRLDLIKKLEAAGFTLRRNNKHAIYSNVNGKAVAVPNHKEINEITAKKILKDAGIQ